MKNDRTTNLRLSAWSNLTKRVQILTKLIASEGYREKIRAMEPHFTYPPSLSTSEWDECAAEGERCGLLNAKEARILANRNPNNHNITPQYIEIRKRWQCEHCHSWIAYSEETGKWRHL